MASKLNNEIRKFQKKYYMTYIPTPSIDDNDIITGLDFENLVDVCRLSCQIWELAHTGMNGLRYENYVETSDFVKVYSSEVCKANSEDLSSIRKWCNRQSLTPEIRRAYWLSSTISNCASISFLFDIVLKKLKNKNKAIIRYDNVLFQLDSAIIRGYSILKKGNFESYQYCNNRVDQSHTKYESHNHVVMIIKDQLNHEYVIDLTGSQFGIFGNVDTPQIVILPIDDWRNRFSSCRDSTPSFPNMGGKLDRIKMIAEIVFNFYYKNNLQTKTLPPSKTEVFTTPSEVALTEARKAVEQMTIDCVAGRLFLNVSNKLSFSLF